MQLINNYYYTEKEIKAMLDSIIIIIDTRENDNKHIIDYFEKKKIAYETKKLETGDYSFAIPENAELNIDRKLYFSHSCAIERKATLEEISNNLTHERTAFENEMIRSTRLKQFYLLIETKTEIEEKQYFENGIKIIEKKIEELGRLEDILYKKYKTDFNEKSFFSSLISFIIRYNIKLMQINKNNSGLLIYYILRNYLKSYLQNKFYK